MTGEPCHPPSSLRSASPCLQNRLHCHSRGCRLYGRVTVYCPQYSSDQAFVCLCMPGRSITGNKSCLIPLTSGKLSLYTVLCIVIELKGLKYTAQNVLSYGTFVRHCIVEVFFPASNALYPTFPVCMYLKYKYVFCMKLESYG